MNFDTSLLEEVLRKLKRKDPVLYAAVSNKISQIVKLNASDLAHYKNLRHNLNAFQRVHIGSFVLFFKVAGDTVIFTRFTHHDDAYRR